MKLKIKYLLLLLMIVCLLFGCSYLELNQSTTKESNRINIIEPLVIYRESDGKMCKPYKAELEIITVGEPYLFEGIVLVEMKEDGSLKITSTDLIRDKYEVAIEKNGWLYE